MVERNLLLPPREKLTCHHHSLTMMTIQSFLMMIVLLLLLSPHSCKLLTFLVIYSIYVKTFSLRNGKSEIMGTAKMKSWERFLALV